MSRDEGPRGGQFVALGEDTIIAGLDRKRAADPGAAGERDYLTVAGAAELAARITAFRRERTPPGRAPVLCTIERQGLSDQAVAQLGIGGGFTLPVVRSNLRNGLPPLGPPGKAG